MIGIEPGRQTARHVCDHKASHRSRHARPDGRFRACGTKELKTHSGQVAGGLFDVVDFEVVRVVDTDDMNSIASPYDLCGFVEQHAHAHCLEPWHHEDAVVVAQHGINRPAQSLAVGFSPLSVAS